MSQKGVISIQHMSHCVFLVRHQGDLRIHADKLNMASIIFPWTDAVKSFIINLTEIFPSVQVFKYPLLKFLFDQLLLLLCQHRFLPV